MTIFLLTRKMSFMFFCNWQIIICPILSIVLKELRYYPPFSSDISESSWIFPMSWRIWFGWFSIIFLIIKIFRYPWPFNSWAISAHVSSYSRVYLYWMLRPIGYFSDIQLRFFGIVGPSSDNFVVINRKIKFAFVLTFKYDTARKSRKWYDQE